MSATALEASERRFRAIAEQAFELLMIVDAGRVVRWANRAFERALGYPPESIIGTGITRLIHHDDLPDLAATIARLSPDAGAKGVLVLRMRAADGTWHTLETSATNLLEDPAIAGFVVSLRDVTEREQVEVALLASQERYRALFERAPDAVYTAELSGRLTSVNPSAERITGYGHDELLEMTIFDLLAPEEHAKALAILAGGAGSDVTAELQLIAKDGRRLFVQVSGRVISPNGEPGHIEGIARDTTERHRLEDELRHRATHDGLTGLPNRTLFMDRLNQAIARAARNGTEVAVMLLDVDDFKLVNDTLGHAVGDELLIELAGRLRALMRRGETVARLGGDEFALLVEGLRSRRGAVALAERVCACFREPFAVDGSERPVTGSLGVVLARDGDEAMDLLRDADTAMYRVKAAGKDAFAFFDAASRAHLLRHLELAKALEETLHERTLEVHYQPIVSLADGEILAVEALSRWTHPDWGVIGADEFIPLAEESGLIVTLGQYVLDESARQLTHWRERAPGALPLGVFVNVSPRELSLGGFATRTNDTLGRHGLLPQDLAFELTERVVVEDEDRAFAQTLAALTASGIRVLLDDFGTGSASLASLERFPLAALKIDRSFIGAIDDPVHDAPITRAIIGLGAALGMTVIAEGVETEIQRDYVRKLGCQAAQGNLLARPQPAEAISKLLGEARPLLEARPLVIPAREPRVRRRAAARRRATNAPIPADDAARLAALRSYDVLDTDPEASFDELTQLAADICETPMAFVSLVDRRREFFKAAVGSARREAPRDVSFCGHAIVEDAPLVVPDTHEDARFADNPDVIGGPMVRFYAGVPLLTPDGHAIAVLCVKDTRPRKLSTRQLEALVTLGRQVMTLLELRRMLLRASGRRRPRAASRAARDRQAATSAPPREPVPGTVASGAAAAR